LLLIVFSCIHKGTPVIRASPHSLKQAGTPYKIPITRYSWSMTTAHISEVALVLSAITALFSGTTWWLTLYDRRAPLILKAKLGDWHRVSVGFFSVTLLVFNPSSRSNCIQGYSLRVKNQDGEWTVFSTETLEVSEEDVKINVLPFPVPSASGVELQVGTVDGYLNGLPDPLLIEIELLDIYNRKYLVPMALRNRYAGHATVTER
jgi:hypothetical protein